jgi:transcriptional regulator with XRE-family HTH domain
VSFVSRNSLTAKLLANKKYRDAYVLEHVKNSIPNQIRALREEREWKQSELGEKAGKQQHGIARLEDPRIGHKLSIKTLLELASAFDVALLVKFVPFSRLLKEYEDVSPEALSAKSITDEEEARKFEEWVTEEDADPIAARAHERIPDKRAEPSASPFRVLEGRNAPTSAQGRLTFLYEVRKTADPTIESLLGTRRQATDKATEIERNPLAQAAAGGGRR